MSRYFRYASIVFAAVTILLLGAIIYVAAIFNPNAYKPEIVRLVKEKKQRQLRLDGPIILVFFPSLGAEFTGLSLSEHNSDEEFAIVENVHVSLAILPLLRKQLVLDEISITGLKANLIRFRDGSTNIDDLIKRDEKAEQFKFDIGRVRVKKTTLAIRDETSEKQLVFRNIKLEADRTDKRSGTMSDAVRSEVELAFDVGYPDRPEIDLETRMTFNLGLNAEKQYYVVDGLNLKAEAQLPNNNQLIINSTGDFFASLAAGAAGEFGANEFTLDIVTRSGGSSFNIEMSAPRLSLKGEKVMGDKVIGGVKVVSPHSHTSGKFSLSDVNGTLHHFRSDALTVEMESKKGDLVIKTMFSSPLDGSVANRWLSLPNLKAEIDIIGSGGPSNGINGNLLGSASVDGLTQNAQAQLNGRLADSNIAAILSANGFTRSNLTFEVDIDKLDLDRFLPQQQEGRQWRKDGSSNLDQPFGLTLLNDLEDLNVEGSIRIGLLIGADLRASKVKLDIRAD